MKGRFLCTKTIDPEELNIPRGCPRELEPLWGFDVKVVAEGDLQGNQHGTPTHEVGQ
jgi:hypothetical protein